MWTRTEKIVAVVTFAAVLYGTYCMSVRSEESGARIGTGLVCKDQESVARVVTAGGSQESLLAVQGHCTIATVAYLRRETVATAQAPDGMRINVDRLSVVAIKSDDGWHAAPAPVDLYVPAAADEGGEKA